MKTKENDVLGLFFENPTKEWHFEEIIKEAKIARSKGSQWLNKFVKEKFIRKIKERGRMPFYVGYYESPEYKNKKRLFALDKIYVSGLLNRLVALEKAKTVILFGSFSRSDWYKDSDIDIFIYGDPVGLKVAEYELKIGKEINLVICSGKKELKKLGNGLIKNIVRGNLIKGDIDFIKVKVNA